MDFSNYKAHPDMRNAILEELFGSHLEAQFLIERDGVGLRLQVDLLGMIDVLGNLDSLLHDSEGTASPTILLVGYDAPYLYHLQFLVACKDPCTGDELVIVPQHHVPRILVQVISIQIDALLLHHEDFLTQLQYLIELSGRKAGEM